MARVLNCKHTSVKMLCDHLSDECAAHCKYFRKKDKSLQQPTSTAHGARNGETRSSTSSPPERPRSTPHAVQKSNTLDAGGALDRVSLFHAPRAVLLGCCKDLPRCRSPCIALPMLCYDPIGLLVGAWLGTIIASIYRRWLYGLSLTKAQSY